MNFSFDNPFWVVMAFIIIPPAVFLFSRMKNPFVLSLPLGAPGGVPFKTSQINGFVRLLKILEIAGIFLLFFSAAGPSIKISETIWLNRGADIIFILDVSPSMAAIDMDGKNRFSTGKAMLLDFAKKRSSDSIGLVATGEDAALILPPTTDREALETRLEQLQIGELGDGTALGMGIAIASYHLEKSNAKHKVAVLITDGENNAGAIHPETAAGFLRDIGASFWVIAIGSAGEIPIDYTDPYTKIRRTGLFDSRYDIETLRRLSTAGGGTFLYASSADTFSAAFRQLDSSEITIQRSRIVNRRVSIFLYFFIPAVFLIITVKFFRRNILGAMI